MNRTSLVALACLSALALPAFGEETKPLKVLYVTGGGYHDYAAQTKILTEGIAARANVQFTVKNLEGALSAAKHPAYQGADWATGYDAVIHNVCHSGQANDEAEAENVARAHRDGVPALFIHCTMHCLRSNESDTWRRMLGVTSKQHEAHHPIDVTRVAHDHPVMKGFPEKWTTPKGELYRILHVWDGVTVLATGVASEKMSHPVAWVQTYGTGRVFGTTLGHFNEEMRTDEFLGMVTRGLLWSCGKLDDAGQPTPGFAAAVAADWSSGVKFPEGEKPVHLFNGKDFDGWEGHTDKYFSVKDGVIVAENTAENAPKVSTYLLTKKHYRNFRIVLEGKLVTSEMHSGVAILGKKFTPETTDETHSYQGHLVMFPVPYGYYDLYRRNYIVPDDGRGKAAGKQHDWNRIEILVIGERIRYVVNGKLATDWTDPMPELCQPGPIGLQLHSNTVPQRIEFRGMVLSENPKDELVTLDGP